MSGPFGPAWTLALFVALAITATVPATRVDRIEHEPPPPTFVHAPGSARCGQWWELAQSVGWPADQMPTVDRVMRCESNCEPRAHNRSGASGLMQLMPTWWRGDGDPYDPTYNLARALDVWHAQGWRAWSCF